MDLLLSFAQSFEAAYPRDLTPANRLAIRRNDRTFARKRQEGWTTCFYLRWELHFRSSPLLVVSKLFMKSSFQRDDLMTILDGIDDAVVKLDGQAHFAAMNQAAADIYQRLGFDPKHMKGKSVWELFPELKGSSVERELRQVLEDHVQLTFEFHYPKDHHWYETKAYPASPGAILVSRDITARKTVS
jgi:PAS domain S-box-containing protein